MPVIGAALAFGKDTNGHQDGAHLRPDPGGIMAAAVRCFVELPGRRRWNSPQLRRRSGPGENVVATMNRWLATMCRCPCGWTAPARTIVSHPGERASPRPIIAEAHGARSRLVVLDYLQLVRSGASTRPQRGTDRGVQAGHRMRAERPRCRSSSSPSSTAESSDGRKARGQ